MIRLGQFQLDIISDGSFWLDGGAMFGVIPRTFWEKVSPPDERNRIHLKMNSLLIRSREHTILVDTGCGGKFDEKFARIYGIQHEERIESELERVGVRPSDIDIVINTHLHFDHCGGNTVRRDGRDVPAFPKARYVVRRGEYDDANAPNERNRASYLPENWRPLEQSGQLEWIDSDGPIVPGVSVVETPGHTRCHQSVRIDSDDGIAFFLADLVPTIHHLKVPWVMGYDLYPVTTMETKKKILPRAQAERWLLMFQHEPDHPIGWLRDVDGKPEFVCWEKS